MSDQVAARCAQCYYFKRGGEIQRYDSDLTKLEVIKEVPKGDVWNAHFICISTDNTKSHGLCLNPKLQSGHKGSWLGIEHNSGECPSDGLRSENDEGRDAFEVGEAFGCVHFSKL